MSRCFPGEALVDKEVFFIVSHRIAEVHVLDAPTVPLELVDNHPTEVLIVDGIVAAQGGAFVVEHDGLVLVRGVVGAEVGHKFGQLALELDVKRFDDVKAFAGGLPDNKPVDVGVVVHAYAILERADLHPRPLCSRELRVESRENPGAAANCCHTVSRAAKVGGVVFVPLFHRGIEAVFGYSDPLTQDRGLESQRVRSRFICLM